MKYLYSSLLLINLISCSLFSSDKDVIIYQSNVEFIDGEYLTDSIGFSEFESVELRSNKYSHSGEYSIKVDKFHPASFKTKIKNVQANEIFYISVWQKKGNSNASLSLSVKTPVDTFLIQSTTDGMMFEKEGWIKHEISFTSQHDNTELNVYVYAGKQDAYFDDIKIERKKNSETN